MSAFLAIELEDKSPDDLDAATNGVLNSRTAKIYTYGMGDSGKSSLVRELLGPSARKKPTVESGANSVTLEKTTYVIPVGDVQVYVVDTPGMFASVDEDHDHRDKTIAKSASGIWEECDKNVGGILLVCIPMHGRIDRCARDLFVELKDALKDKIWQYVIIALTKADEYPEEEWLADKPSKVSKRQYLTQKFDESLRVATCALHKIFTSRITEKAFEKISILPTSQLACGTSALRQMEKVGRESWFDVLLLECCKKEAGIGILTIHQDRLSNLSKEILEKAGYSGDLGQEAIPFFRELMEEKWAKLGHLAWIVGWKISFYLYTRKTEKYSRFQLAKKQND